MQQPAGEPAQPQGLVGAVERGGQPAPGGLGTGPARRAQGVGERVEDRGDRRSLTAERTARGARRAQYEPEQEQPQAAGEDIEGLLPRRPGQRHPGTQDGGGQHLHPGVGAHRPGHAARAGDEADGEQCRNDPPVRVGRLERGADQHAERRREGGQTDMDDAGTPGAGAVVDPRQHRAETGQDTGRRVAGRDARAQQRPGAQRTAGHGRPGHGQPLPAERVGQPGGDGARRAEHGPPQTTAYGRRKADPRGGIGQRCCYQPKVRDGPHRCHGVTSRSRTHGGETAPARMPCLRTRLPTPGTRHPAPGTRHPLTAAPRAGTTPATPPPPH